MESVRIYCEVRAETEERVEHMIKGWKRDLSYVESEAEETSEHRAYNPK